MTELSFLLDLLLNHRLPKSAKDLILVRVKEVELSQRNIVPSRPTVVAHPATAQAASTQAILDRNPDLAQPVVSVAQTPATQMAMASRQTAIAESLAGKVDKQTGRPRKF